MSTSVRGPPAPKKISSWVRPGVCEVRASELRVVSALMRLDLPPLERPANAISTPSIGGSDSNDAAADRNRHSAANSLRPVSLSPAVNGDVDRNRADQAHDVQRKKMAPLTASSCRWGTATSASPIARSFCLE